MNAYSELIVTKNSAFEAEPPYLQRQVEAKSSEKLVCELLTKRLDASSPFGIPTRFLIFTHRADICET